VWVLEDEGGGVYAARERTIQLGDRSGGDIGVTAGLAAGERIAAAGVAILTEGRRVRLLEDTSGPKAPAPAAEAPAEAAP